MAIKRKARGPFWHVMKSERGKKDPARAMLRPLTVQLERIVVEGRFGGTIVTDADFLKHMLVELEHFLDDDDKPIAVQTDADGLVTDETLNWLTQEERSELAEASRSAADLSETDRKN